MSDLETLKKENETLKNQMAANSQGIHGLLAQCDAFKGELADARLPQQTKASLLVDRRSRHELDAG